MFLIRSLALGGAAGVEDAFCPVLMHPAKPIRIKEHISNVINLSRFIEFIQFLLLVIIKYR